MGVSPSPRRYWRRGSGRRSQQQTCAAVVLPMDCNILTSMPPPRSLDSNTATEKSVKTYQSNWIISTGRGENKTYLKPPPRIHDRNTPIKWNNPFQQPGSCFSVKVSRPGDILRQYLALPPCWDPFFLEGARNSQHYAGCRLTLAARGYIHIIIFTIIYISVHIYASFEDE